MNKIAIISDTEPIICNKFIELGFKLIYTEPVDGFISYEQKHADLQCISVNEKIFILSECKTISKILNTYGFDTISASNKALGKYPHNILLNAKIVGKHIIGKIEHLDKTLKDYCIKENYDFINVNQGYTGCSCLKVDDNSIITSDISIYNALSQTDIEVLKIREGNIKLSGVGEDTYGFIGGASTKINENQVLFFGDIKNHPDYLLIKDFCNARNVGIDYIENFDLTDIGSAILLNF